MNQKNLLRVKDFLDEIVAKLNQKSFIEYDPISIPHAFTHRQDIEISGLFAAVLSWGNRKTIISKCKTIIDIMDNSPYDFIIHHTDQDLKKISHFAHRTFQTIDLLYFFDFFKRFYQTHYSLEEGFMHSDVTKYQQKQALAHFHNIFFDANHAPKRTQKHVSTPLKGSTCKRLNMYLRWMVRRDDQGVDFGIWNNIPMHGLMIPFDTHVARNALALGLIQNAKNTWATVESLTATLRQMDDKDPIKYDFALFGIGIHPSISIPPRLLEK